jgi:hypothetical protein
MYQVIKQKNAQPEQNGKNRVWGDRVWGVVNSLHPTPYTPNPKKPEQP